MAILFFSTIFLQIKLPTLKSEQNFRKFLYITSPWIIFFFGLIILIGRINNQDATTILLLGALADSILRNLILLYHIFSIVKLREFTVKFLRMSYLKNTILLIRNLILLCYMFSIMKLRDFTRKFLRLPCFENEILPK